MNFLSTGEKIKRARIYKGMTLKELCQKDISISRMSCIENGKVTPERWVLELIAERLELNLEYLLSDDISQIKKSILKYSNDITIYSDSDCEEILKNIDYTIEREYYDLGFKLMHLLFRFYVNYRKFHRIPHILNTYNLLADKNEELAYIYCEDLSGYFVIRQNYRDAITYLNTLLSIYSRKEIDHEIEEKIIVAKLFKAICYYKIDNLEKVQNIISSICETINEDSDERKYDLVNGVITIIKIRKGEDYKESLNKFQNATDKPRGYYKLKMLVGEAFFESGNIEDGIKQFEDLENEVYEKNKILMVERLLIQGKALIKFKKFSEANEYCDKALQMAIELDNIVYIENGYYLKSIIAKSQGSFIQWEMYMNLAMDLLLKFGTYIEKQDRYVEMANMYHVIGETRESLKYLSLSIEGEKILY